MKKLLFLILSTLLTVHSWATMGSPTVANQGTNVRSANQLVTFPGTLSGTGAADISGAINANGFDGVQFKFVKAAYNGTLQVQGSWDNSSWSTIWEASLDGTALTETINWQNFDGWNYYRIVGDPNGSNAGTCTISAKLIWSGDNSPHYSGYYGIPMEGRELLASAARTASTSAYTYTTSKGIMVNLNCTAASSGSITLSVSTVSPTGVATKLQSATVISAAGDRTIIISPNVAPVSTPASSSVPFIQNGTGSRWLVSCDAPDGNSITYSVAVRPIFWDGFPLATR